MKNKKSSEMLDVDVRFLLANERTLLAWVRTALAVIAIGLAMTQLGNESRNQTIVGVLLIILGAVMTTIGYVRFKDADKAIRSGNLPDIGKGPRLQVISVICFSLVVATLELVRLN